MCTLVHFHRVHTTRQVKKQNTARAPETCLCPLLAELEETAALAPIPVTSFARSRTSADGLMQCLAAADGSFSLSAVSCGYATWFCCDVGAIRNKAAVKCPFVSDSVASGIGTYGSAVLASSFCLQSRPIKDVHV